MSVHELTTPKDVRDGILLARALIDDSKSVSGLGRGRGDGGGVDHLDLKCNERVGTQLGLDYKDAREDQVPQTFSPLSHNWPGNGFHLSGPL